MTGLVAVKCACESERERVCVCGCKGQARRARLTQEPIYNMQRKRIRVSEGVRALLARYLQNGTYQAMDGDSALC